MVGVSLWYTRTVARTITKYRSQVRSLDPIVWPYFCQDDIDDEFFNPTMHEGAAPPLLNDENKTHVKRQKVGFGVSEVWYSEVDVAWSCRSASVGMRDCAITMRCGVMWCDVACYGVVVSCKTGGSIS